MKKGFMFYEEEKFKQLELDGVISLQRDDVLSELMNSDYSKALFISIAVDKIKDFDLAIRVFQKYLFEDIPIILFNRRVEHEFGTVTHTGKLIKDYQIFNSLMEKYGVINCYTFEELIYATKIFSMEELKRNASNVQLVNVDDDIRKVVLKEMDTVEESVIHVTTVDQMGNCLSYGKVTFIVDEMLTNAVMDVSDTCIGSSLIVPNSRVFFKMLNQCIERLTRSFDFSNMALTTNTVLGERTVLSELESRSMLKDSGIRFDKSLNVTSLEEAIKAAENFGFPLVLKVNSLDIPHKSDVGGVVVGIKDMESFKAAYVKMEEDIAKNCPDAVIQGIIVSEFSPKGFEIILGTYNHDVYGPVVMVGYGGTTCEVFKDVAYAPIPCNIQDAKKMVESLDIYPLLTGYRSAPLLNVERLVTDIVSMSKFMLKNIDSIKEIDINPLFIYEEGKASVAVDALIVTKN